MFSDSNDIAMQSISDKLQEHKEATAKNTEWSMLFKEQRRATPQNIALEPLDKHMERVYRIKKIQFGEEYLTR